MAVRQITTEISIKNEAEFRKQMKAVNNSLSGMKSEMAKVSAEFDGQANSAEALRKKQAILQQQYDQQTEKVRHWPGCWRAPRAPTMRTAMWF